MFRNYFKIAWRNLFRNKGFSITNILGLTIGITCTILILLWVEHELTYNKFHANYNSIYKVMATRDFNNQVFTDGNMVLPLADVLQEKLPQIKNAAVTTHRHWDILTYGDDKLKKFGYNVSEHFFEMFSWKFIEGNASTAITDPSSIVLTKSTAKAFFGNQDPINKILRVDNDRNAKVTAVVEDVPGNSTLQFDYIMPFNYSNEDVKQSMTQWQNSSWNVFVQTVPGANLHTIEKKINEIKYQHDPDDKKISTYFTFPMSKWQLYSDFKDGKNVGGMIEYVRLFTVIALIILLIACVNFMNLSTARSEKRAKEVGVRKTLGSDKRQLILQFFFESMILAFIAFVFSVIAVYLLLPSFNNLVDKHLSLDIAQPIFWLGALAIIVFTGVVAGSYPALYLSSFNPVRVLKGTFLPGKTAALPRRILVVAQFVISILLISATIIVYQQIQHIKNRDIGYNPNNLIMIPASPDVNKNYAVIKQELLNQSIIFARQSTDVDFTKTMGIKILEGKDFSGTPSDTSAMLLNKAAVEAMGVKHPVGMQMRYGNDNPFTVIGVTDNVIMGSPF